MPKLKIGDMIPHRLSGKLSYQRNLDFTADIYSGFHCGTCSDIYTIKDVLTSDNDDKTYYEVSGQDSYYYLKTDEVDLHLADNGVWFSVSFKEFISSKKDSCRILEDLEKCFNDTALAEKTLTDSKINYLTKRRNGLVSYLPSNKPLILNENGDWSREGRQEGKLAKVLRKVLKDGGKGYKDEDWECLTNLYKASGGDVNFEVLGREKIEYVYCDMERDGSGRLEDSCMNGEDGFLKMYTDCEALQILVCTNKEGLLIGRALLWDIGNGEFFLDRFYTAYDWLDAEFIDYAVSKGWWRKDRYDSYEERTSWISPTDGNCYNKQVTICLDTDFDAFPYIDTFVYGEDGSINNYEESSIYTYKETNGERWEETVWDAWNEEDIPLDQAILLHNGEYTHQDNAVYVDREGEYYLKYDVEVIGDDYEVSEDCVSTPTGRSHKENAEEIEGPDGEDIWIKNEDIVIDVEGDYQYYLWCTMMENGEYVLTSKLEEYEKEQAE